jgi:hypothetical protein
MKAGTGQPFQTVEIKMKKIAWAAGFGLCLAASVAFAQDNNSSMSAPSGSASPQSQGQMSQGGMSNGSSGSMSSGSMSSGSMSQQNSGAMNNQGMAGGAMKKPHAKKPAKPADPMSSQSGTMSGPSPEH